MADSTRIRKHDPRKQPTSIGPTQETQRGNRNAYGPPQVPPKATKGPERPAEGRSPKARVVKP
jgi:hypothetical protein